MPGLLQCVQEVTYASAQGVEDVQVLRTLLYFLPTWLPWALFTPAVLAIARRYPLERGELVRSLAVHTVACLFFGALHLVLLGLVRTHFPPGPWAPRELGSWLARTLWSLHSQAVVLAYFGIVVAGHALEALRAARIREVSAVRLEGQLTEARLTALRGQLQPHFLFNTLNSIDVLMVDDPERAGVMLRRLGDLLRHTLEDGGQQHALGRELEHLRCYLDIEAVRFSDRLRVEMEVDEDTLELAIPGLLLQPIAENALRHGIAPRAQGGCITIRARRSEEWLVVEVEDDGAGFDGPAVEGIGLRNSRARLAELYGEQQALTVRSKGGSGTLVTLRLPAKRAEGST